jgi:hypothetical protein
MGDFLGLLTFVVSVILVLWVAGEMLGSVLPAPVTSFARALFRATFFGLVAIGRFTENLALALWRGQPQRAAAPAPVSTVPQARPQAYVQPWRVNDDDRQTDHGLSGLSADFEAPDAPDAAQAYIESLDSGSRKQAVAILVRAGWGTGKIRNALVGDNGEIGREAAEARQAMGLAEPSPARVTPLAEREIPPDLEFAGQPKR